jgi:arylsulfatase A-like enzyme
MKGLDLSNLLKGQQDISEWRDAVLLENFFIQELLSAGRKRGVTPHQLNEEVIANNRSYRTLGVRTERYKYFKYHEHDPVIEELYDLKTDPHEQLNLISSPEHAAVIERLREETQDLYARATESRGGGYDRAKNDMDTIKIWKNEE